MKQRFVRTISTAVLMSLVLQLAACGTLMFPERRGQKAGEIDVKVAILDGILLVFGIIPGVVAYIVDFSTGAIYLPAGKKNHLVQGEYDQITVIRVPPEVLRNPAAVREIVSREMELPCVVNWDRLQTSRIKSEQIRTALVEARATSYTH